MLLVKDTSSSSLGTPWAAFCPLLDVVRAGRDPQDALNMIADAIYEASVDGVIAAEAGNYDEVVGFYNER